MTLNLSKIHSYLHVEMEWLIERYPRSCCESCYIPVPPSMDRHINVPLPYAPLN